MDVVLDLAFWSREERKEATMMASACGADVLLYRVNCPDHVARRRLRIRNEKLKDNLLINDATYDLLEARFERLAPEEVQREVVS